MKRIGFPISQKENEKRRALVPEDIIRIRHKDCLVFETGYGDVLGFRDDDYRKAGAQIAGRREVLSQEIICDPKIGDAAYLKDLSGQTIFGWVHAVQNREIADVLVDRRLTAFAWEDMFDCGRHLFWRNNEIAGEAAIMHAFQLYGKMPYGTKVALIGRGNVASGALKILTLLGADVTVFGRKTEKLIQRELPIFDVVVNAVLWDIYRKDHLISYSDLKRMKSGAMIVDISCDRHGAIESSIPTTIDNPVYVEDGILHYVVDHTPSLFFKDASAGISKVTSMFVDELIEDKPGEILCSAKCVGEGTILDRRIIDFQKRTNN